MRTSGAVRFSLAAILWPALAWGQGSVTIFGSVTDSSGAVVPGVGVAVTNTATGVARSTVSDPTGNYVVSQLPIGVYALKAEAPGFKAFVQENIRVQVDENRQINIVMQVGAVTESINVAAEITQVETRSGSLREVVDSDRIVGLPLNGRNPLQ
ncbi:MAG: carboxypeptidase-like regulatory domain-containing protein, partial [Acidobacteriota bacterium]